MSLVPEGVVGGFACTALPGDLVKSPQQRLIYARRIGRAQRYPYRVVFRPFLFHRYNTPIFYKNLHQVFPRKCTIISFFHTSNLVQNIFPVSNDHNSVGSELKFSKWKSFVVCSSSFSTLRSGDLIPKNFYDATVNTTIRAYVSIVFTRMTVQIREGTVVAGIKKPKSFS